MCSIFSNYKFTSKPREAVKYKTFLFPYLCVSMLNKKMKSKVVFIVMIYTTTTVFRSSIMKNMEKMLRFITSTNASYATVKLGKKSLQERIFFKHKIFVNFK